MTDLSIVVVSYNCRDRLTELLRSIYEYTKSISFEVIVIDNASEDGADKSVKGQFPQVRFIQNRENRWLRPAMNQGIRESNGRYILLLNPDTRLLTPEGLGKMLQYMDRHPEIGILGSKLINPDGSIQQDCQRFPGLGWAFCHSFFINQIWPQNPLRQRWQYQGWDRNDTRAVDTISGACMMVRKDVFERVGLLFEGSQIYWEEAELCRGARKAGWLTVHFADTEILHYWRQGGVSVSSRSILQTAMEQSMLYYYRKYYGVIIYAILAVLSWLRMGLFKILKRLRSLI